MTNNIEKLYEWAVVENYRLYNYVGIEPKGYKFILNKDNPNKVEKVVRDFSAEKQLNLINWLVTNWGSFTLYRTEDGFLCNCHSFSSCFCETEKQALAGLVCELWEDLADTQREKVRGILE